MFSSRSRLQRCAAVVALSLVVTATVSRADEERARAYLQSARDDVKNGNYDSVERDLELMAEQFVGVPDAAKAKLTADGEAVRKEAADGKFAAKFDDAEKKLAEIAADKDFAKYTKAYAANPQGGDEKLLFENVTNAYARFETDTLKDLPAKHPRTIALAAKFAAAAAPVQRLALAGRKAELFDKLTAVWAEQKKQAGELKDADPLPYDKWVESDVIVAADKSFKWAVALRELLENADVKQFENAFAADDPKVGALFKEMRGVYDAATVKVMAEATARIESARTAKGVGNSSTRISQLRNEVEKLAPVKGQAEAVAALDAQLKRWTMADANADAAQQAKIEAMQASAKEMWGPMVAQYDGKTVEIDPAVVLKDVASFRDKLVRFTDKPNVAGTLFGSPDYAYVTTVNGQPVAFRFSAKCRVAADAWAAFNSGRPISYGDFRDVVGRVVAVGKVNQLRHDADRDEYVVAGLVDCPVLEMVAFHSRYVSHDDVKGSNADGLKPIAP